MASRGDEEFLAHAMGRGFLRTCDETEIRAGCAEMAVCVGRPVPFEHFVRQHGWLSSDSIDAISSALHRRIMLCPSCWARLNVYGSSVGKGVVCGHCKARLSVPAGRHAEVLDRQATETSEESPPAKPPVPPKVRLAAASKAGSGEPGDVLDRFELPGFEMQDRLDHGDMSVVFKARQLPVDRLVAVKVLRRQFTSDATLVRRFFREARAIGRIEHPNVVRIHYAASQEDHPYIVLSWTEGRSLRELLEERGTLMTSRALAYAADAARGLAAAHAHGVVHRNVKSSNILLRTDGTACVIGFGLALLLDPKEERITQKGEFLGSPNYMSPEQCRDPHHALPPSDIYSLGATLYELLAGKAPFDGEDPRSIARSLRAGQVPRLDEIPHKLPPEAVALVHHLMAVDPAARPSSMALAATELERAQAAVLGRAATGRPRPEDTQVPYGE
ncbi:MAG: serine/threonine protein kinase [Planctomycetes bacterium]|nr:serine/threonine protein kinase [Planctomycetota bacterium]